MVAFKRLLNTTYYYIVRQYKTFLSIRDSLGITQNFGILRRLWGYWIRVEHFRERGPTKYSIRLACTRSTVIPHFALSHHHTTQSRPVSPRHGPYFIFVGFEVLPKQSHGSVSHSMIESVDRDRVMTLFEAGWKNINNGNNWISMKLTVLQLEGPIYAFEGHTIHHNNTRPINSIC